jgi:LysR family glycine cleavage system transcriptional activator
VLTANSDPKQLPPLARLRAFEAVGRLCGIRKAAQELRVDHAVVSRHLRSLEEWAGVRLLNREQGRAVLTDEGLRFYSRIAAALNEISGACAELLRRNDTPRLRIWCIPGFASEWLACRLGAFQAENPGVDLELHPTDKSPDFSRYEADVDIRYVAGSTPISASTMLAGVRRFQIARPPVTAVVSPSRKSLLSNVRTPADLLQAPLLHEESPDQWRAWFQAHGIDIATPLPGPRLWHAHLTIEAARRGQGVALANPFLLGDDLAAGRLVPLLSEAGSPGAVELGAYAFAARADRWQSPAIASFRRWLKSATAVATSSTRTIAFTPRLQVRAVALGSPP